MYPWTSGIYLKDIVGLLNPSFTDVFIGRIKRVLFLNFSLSYGYNSVNIIFRVLLIAHLCLNFLTDLNIILKTCPLSTLICCSVLLAI